MDRFSVVIADDHADLREIVSTALGRTPWFTVVGEAADGEEAVQRAGELQPDLLVLDIDMPKLTGLEALPEIRRAAPGTKVVVLSGYQESAVGHAARSSGAVGYLEKGLSPQVLVDQLLAVAGVLETVQGAIEEARAKLANELTSPRRARRFVEETLARWRCGEVLDVVNLLVSELVANAVVHGGSDVDVAVVLQDAALRVEVSDTSDAPVQPRQASPGDASGRGLELVEALSARWGVEPTATGKTVWFEVRRPDR